MNRRQFLASPLLLAAQTPSPNLPKRLRVACVGGHPDDPESGCGGTLRLYAEQGHEVTVVYLTRGEAGIAGTAADKAAAIRSAEAETACRILGAQPRFAGQIDGATEITPQRIEQLAQILTGLNPDVILTHWPVDTHPDHAIAGHLTLRICLAKLPAAVLYFFEVLTGRQTLNFHPTDYVDIHSSRDAKRRATFAHKSQKPEEWYSLHEDMEKFRGAECGVPAAEGFVHLARLTKGTAARLLP